MTEAEWGPDANASRGEPSHPETRLVADVTEEAADADEQAWAAELAGLDQPDDSGEPKRAWPRLRRAVNREGLTTVERLRDGQAQLRDRALGWAVTIVITVIAGLLRFQGLA